MSDYKTLTSRNDMESAVDQKVVFTARRSTIFAQHMMSMVMDESFTPMAHFYIAPDPALDVYEILAYFSRKHPVDTDALADQPFRIYGTLKVVSGAGKGGGEHREFYLILDKIETL